MKFNKLFLSVLTFISVNASNESIRIVNGTDHSLYVDFTIPSHCRADIVITKLNLQNMLYAAILNDSIEEVNQAIQAGANATWEKDGKSPLSMAVLLKRSNIIKVLLRRITKINSTNKTLVRDALKLGDIESALLLVKKGADVSQCIDQCMRLCVHALARNVGPSRILLELMQELINRGYDVNKIWYTGPDENGHVHDIYRNIEALNLFIRNGANPNHIIHGFEGSPWGTSTPLMRVTNFSNSTYMPVALNVLIDAGADVNQKANPYPNHPNSNLRGLQTPLSLAIARGNTSIIEFLIKHGANF